MIKLKELLNEGDLKEVKYQIKHLNEYLKSHEEALKKYKKWLSVNLETVKSIANLLNELKNKYDNKEKY